MDRLGGCLKARSGPPVVLFSLKRFGRSFYSGSNTSTQARLIISTILV